MLRKLIFAVCALALTLASCGRQVTPNRTTSPSGLTAGQMQITFQTQGPADFVNNVYVLAFNTSGTGSEPLAYNGNQTNNWLDYSFAIYVSQPNANSPVQATVYQFASVRGLNATIKTPVIVQNILPQDLIVTPNCGTQNQFCVLLSRSVFSNAPYCTATPAPSTATPSPTPTPTATATATATPSSPCVTNTWFINWMVASPGGNPPGQVISAAGPNGITSASGQFIKQYNVSTSFNQPWTQPLPPAVPQAPSQASQITGGAVVNNP